MPIWPPYDIDIESWEDRSLLVIAQLEDLGEADTQTYWVIVHALLETWFGEDSPVDDLIDEGRIDGDAFMVLVLIQELALDQTLGRTGEAELFGGDHD